MTLCLDQFLLTRCVRGEGHEGDHKSAFGATWPRTEHPLERPQIDVEPRTGTGEGMTEESQTHCFWHQVDEPLIEDSYKCCFECGHVWQTEKNFTDDVEELYEELRKEYAAEDDHIETPAPDDVTYCPLCAHDF